MSVTPQEAAAHLLRIREAEESFLGFVKAMCPQFTLAPFQVELIEVLDKLEKGTLTHPDTGEVVHRLMINMPPRHGKSWLASTLFPTYYIAKNPTGHVLATSYNADLAKEFGRAVRDNALNPVVGQAFPDFGMSSSSSAADNWHTSMSGAYFATGMQGSTTGHAATCLIIDDPVKNREEADSATQRNKNWSYYLSSLVNRKQPLPDGRPPIEIVILTRWHPDDLGGRIQDTEDWKEGDWFHVNLQAIEEKNTNIKMARSALPPSDPRYLPPGELSKITLSKRHVMATEQKALWPERFPLEMLLKMKRLSPRDFEALYQQNPYIEGGNIIKETWWQYDDDRKDREYASIIIGADTAFKKTEKADYSVFVVAGLDNAGDMHIIDVVRGKFDFPELKRKAIAVNNKYRGHGLRGFYIEDKASGQSLVQELKTQSGLSVIPVKVTHDKVSRINAITPLIEGGRVFLPKEAPWIDEFLEEARQFPTGTHDDQMDALAIALDQLSRTSLMPSWDNPTFGRPLIDAVGNKSLWDNTPQRDARLFKGWGE